MSKIKLSFSFLLTLVLVGMLSVVAFAAAPTAPTGLKGVLQKQLSTSPTGQGVTEYDLDLSWDAIAGATTYKVYLNGAEVADQAGLTYSFANIENEASIEVQAVNADGSSDKTAFAWNSDVNVTKAANDSENDNSLVNANQTGLNVGGENNNFSTVIKSGNMANKDGSTSTHRTHGDYANNTNSCASCHQTHTAASKNLLFKNGVYATCTACHDGTLGFYNVFGSGSASAGTFGGTQDGNMSVHLATGAVAIKAAPGGNKTGEGSWAGEFTCASCHAPHGSYSDRLLHYNPNDTAVTPIATGGQKVVGSAVVDTLPATKDNGDFVFLRTKNIDATMAAKFPQLGVGATVIQLYKWVQDHDSKTAGDQSPSYDLDTTPWVYTGTYDATHTYKVYDTAFWASKPTTTEKDIYMAADIVYPLKKNQDIRQANNWIGSPTGKTALIDAVTTGDAARAYVVDLDMKADPAFPGKPVFTTNVLSLWNGANWDETGAPKSGKGVVMSGFCAACHTDYLAKSGSESGTYSHAYRHTTTSDTYSCVRCHFAHGTDVTVMKDAQGFTAQQLVDNGQIADITKANAYMLDKDPSSALKRYTNMSVCWGCHTSSHAEGLRNSSTYGDDSDDPMPGGLTVNQ